MCSILPVFFFLLCFLISCCLSYFLVFNVYLSLLCYNILTHLYVTIFLILSVFISFMLYVVSCLLCILTSFRVLRAPESWSNYFFQLFSRKKLENGWKKVVQPAFGCTQHPKAGRYTQQLSFYFLNLYVCLSWCSAFFSLFLLFSLSSLSNLHASFYSSSYLLVKQSLG